MFYSVVWAGLLLLTLARTGRSRHGSIGLPFALIASYTASHAGALVHLVDSYEPALYAYQRGFGYTRQTVADGLEASCIAMLFATLGFALVDLTLKARTITKTSLNLEVVRKSAWIAIALGLAAFSVGLALSRMGISIPGMQAVLTALRNLLVVGASGVVLHRYLTKGARSALLLTIFFALLLPGLLLVTTAILADSIELSIVSLAFYFSLRRVKSGSFGRNLSIFCAVFAVSVVFSIGYLQYRDILRNVVWGGGSIEDALGVASNAAKDFEIGKAGDNEALAMLDIRLNQNIFIGLAIDRLRSDQDSYEQGASIVAAMVGWVPRIIWPEKPQRGGSAFIAKHTGLSFSEGTTFGAGPIFELFVNFGYIGVAIGFAFCGMLVRVFDIYAFRALQAGDLPSFAQYQLAGMALLPALADLLFLTTALATALLVGWGLRFAWRSQILRLAGGSL